MVEFLTFEDIVANGACERGVLNACLKRGVFAGRVCDLLSLFHRDSEAGLIKLAADLDGGDYGDYGYGYGDGGYGDGDDDDGYGYGDGDGGGDDGGEYGDDGYGYGGGCGVDGVDGYGDGCGGYGDG